MLPIAIVIADRPRRDVTIRFCASLVIMPKLKASIVKIEACTKISPVKIVLILCFNTLGSLDIVRCIYIIAINPTIAEIIPVISCAIFLFFMKLNLLSL